MEIIKIKTADDFHNENVKPGHVIEKYKKWWKNHPKSRFKRINVIKMAIVS